MPKVSLKSLFTAAVMSAGVVMTGFAYADAPSFNQPQPMQQAQQLLAQDGWYPVARGVALHPVPGRQAPATSNIIVFFNQDTDTLRIGEVQNRRFRQLYEGTLQNARLPVAPHHKASLDLSDLNIVPVQQGPNNQQCGSTQAIDWNRSRAGEGVVMEFIEGDSGALMRFYAVDNPAGNNSWALTVQHPGADRTCIVRNGVFFQFSPAFHYGPGDLLPRPTVESAAPMVSENTQMRPVPPT